jgi:hypothetical protein
LNASMSSTSNLLGLIMKNDLGTNAVALRESWGKRET